MKLQYKLILSASAASVLAFASLAQESPTTIQVLNDAASQRAFAGRLELLKHTATASEIIGKDVQNSQHESLGKVADLALDVVSGRIVEVILSSGGLLGVNRAFTAVPPGALRCELGDQILHLNASRQTLAAAPKFDFSHWDNSCQSNQVAEVYAYFKEQPFFVSDRDGYWTGHPDGTFTETVRPQKEDIKAGDIVPNEVANPPGEAENNIIVTRNPDGTLSRNYYSSSDQAISTWSELGFIQKASRLIGMPVRNLQNEKLGHVNNFIVDLSAGRIAAVFISARGFMGLNAEYSSAPATKFLFSADHKALILDATPEMLSLSGNFNINQWPNFPLPGYRLGEYYPYKIAPYNNINAPDRFGNGAQKIAHQN